MESENVVLEVIGSEYEANSMVSFVIDTGKNDKNWDGNNDHDECWYLVGIDTLGNGICCDYGYGYFSLNYLSGNKENITLGKQTYYGDEIEFYWCNSFFADKNNVSAYGETAPNNCEFFFSVLQTYDTVSKFEMTIEKIINETDYPYVDILNSDLNPLNFSNFSIFSDNTTLTKVYWNQFRDQGTTSNNHLCISDGCYIVLSTLQFGRKVE